jgi:hypothetical protein
MAMKTTLIAGRRPDLKLPFIFLVDPHIGFWTPDAPAFREVCHGMSAWCQTEIPRRDWKFTMQSQSDLGTHTIRDIYWLQGRFSFRREDQAFAFKLRFG